jgi:glycosyltransferase involved in cell wall biosynthesis
VSFAVPIYNGEASIRNCLDSILAQEFTDFEVVVCDNASTDRTAEIVAEYAKLDDRIRVHRNDANIGLIGNFNRVFELTRGEYFRWIGADDWLEPQYASECVGALDADPGAILATSYFTLNQSDGRSECREFRGEFLESERRERRFARALWFFHAGAGLFEPIYSLMRRDVLATTGRVRMAKNNDWMLAAELSLKGRFLHVPKRLFHRTWRPDFVGDEGSLLDWFSPGRGNEISSSTSGVLRVLVEIIRAADLSPRQRASCYGAALRFCASEAAGRLRSGAQRVRREKLGLTGDRLRGLIGGAR